MTYKIIKIIALFLVLFVAALVFNLLTLSSKQLPSSDLPLLNVNKSEVAMRLGQAVAIDTIAVPQDDAVGLKKFSQFADLLESSYPLIHQSLTRTFINQHSIVFRWQGRNPQLKPIMLLAHMDVVPVDPSSIDRWQYPAFDGRIEEGFIWGRGTLDDKGSLMSIMEAGEALLQQGFQPERDIYFGFGHDEEIGGQHGAVKIVEWLKENSVTLDTVIDEGMIITNGGVPGIEQPVALIGIAEKGYLSLALKVESEGGHASMPPNETAISILASAVTRLNEQQMTAELAGPIKAMFTTLAPHSQLPHNLIFSNLTLLDPIVQTVFSGNAATNAMLRTTTAATQFSSGVKDNVLPTQATAVLNFRIHPNDSISAVKTHVTEVINDARVVVDVNAWEGQEPSSVSSTESQGFQAIQVAVKTVYPDVLSAPSLMIGASDSRHYADIADNIYRFNPIMLTPDNFDIIHGSNERISIDNYAQSIQFYHQFMQLATRAPSAAK